MLKKERHDMIMRQINLHNRVLTSDLVQLLNVSEDTVRRDLQELVDAGSVYKVHGGALSKSYQSTFDDSTIYAREQKIVIAKKAAQLIKEGMVVLLGGGTTVLELVKYLPMFISGTFFTISPLVAVELAKYPNIEVILIGGTFSKNSQVCFGGSVIAQLNEIKVDLCITGTSALHAEAGLTDTNWEINQLKKAMFNCAHKRAVICISEKLNIALRLKVCSLHFIDFLITELSPNDEGFQSYRSEQLVIL